VTIIFENPSSIALYRSDPRNPLFLLVRLLLRLGLGALLADADKAGLGAGVTELPVGVVGGRVVLDVALLERGNVGDGQDLAGGLDEVLTLLGGRDFLSGSVTTLRLAVAAREEDELLPVLLEALHVGLEALLGQILAAGVDGDTDGARELARDTGSYSKLVHADVYCAKGSYSSAQRERNHGRGAHGGCLQSKSAVISTLASQLYIHLTVGHRTTGRSLSTGRGATLAAFATRALRLDFFLPG
jgi:hypothetical protein